MSSNATDHQKKTCTDLHKAVKACDKNLVQHLIESGADVNAEDNKDRTPLDLAVMNKKCANLFPTKKNEEKRLLKIANLLIKAGAIIKNKTLRSVVALQNDTMVEFLLQNGVDVGSKFMMGGTLLHLAVLVCELETGPKIVQILLEHGIDVNAVNKYKSTALHTAVNKRNKYTVKLIKLLLRYGADVNRKNVFGCTAAQNFISIHGNDSFVDPCVLKSLLVGNDKEIMNPLHEACLFHRFESVRELLWKGMDINAIDSIGNTALFYALISQAANKQDKYSTVKLLLGFHPEKVWLIGLDIDRKLVDIFSSHVILMYFAKWGIAEKNGLQKLLQIDPRQFFAGCKSVQKYCLNNSFVSYILKSAMTKKLRSQTKLIYINELKSMMMKKLGTTGISFYDLLKAHLDKRATYARNKQIMEYFEAGKGEFPMYQDILEGRLYKCFKRLRLIEGATEVLINEVVDYNDSFFFFANTFFENCMCYLSNNELKRIISMSKKMDSTD